MVTQANTRVLPTELAHTAPLHPKDDKSWFIDENLRYDLSFFEALIVEAIGEHDCPTIGRWVTFAVAGGVIAYLTGQYIVPPKPEPAFWESDLEKFVWEALWQATTDHPDLLDRTFAARVLRLFMPREHYTPPSRPYFRSEFVYNWNFLSIADTTDSSVGNIRLKVLREGRNALRLFTANIQQEIEQVAPYVPPLLDIAIARIHETYMW